MDENACVITIPFNCISNWFFRRKHLFLVVIFQNMSLSFSLDCRSSKTKCMTWVVRMKRKEVEDSGCLRRGTWWLLRIWWWSRCWVAYGKDKVEIKDGSWSMYLEWNRWRTREECRKNGSLELRNLNMICKLQLHVARYARFNYSQNSLFTRYVLNVSLTSW